MNYINVFFPFCEILVSQLSQLNGTKTGARRTEARGNTPYIALGYTHDKFMDT